MASLVDGWLQKLTGMECKLAVWLYRELHRREGRELTASIAEIARATGISWRTTQAVLKRLAARGVIACDSRQGHKTRIRLPEPALPPAHRPTPQPQQNPPECMDSAKRPDIDPALQELVAHMFRPAEVELMEALIAAAGSETELLKCLRIMAEGHAAFEPDRPGMLLRAVSEVCRALKTPGAQLPRWLGELARYSIQ